VSLPVRIGTLFVAFLAVVGGAIFVVINFFLSGPPAVAYTTSASSTGQVVRVVMQEAAQTSTGTRPAWVSYFLQDPQTHAWVHSTIFRVPARARVDVTILGYDGCTPLRNPYWGKVTGTIGNSATINGKKVSFLNSWGQCAVAHTFSIPGIGLNVPAASPTTLADNKNLCSTSPCTDPKANPHTVVQFSFTSPATAGDYFWQCRIPCGLGYLDGFGGPMQTIGYMTGQMQVVS